MRVHIADHPLIAHKLTALRDKNTVTPTCRRLADELVTLLAYEATREVRVEPVDIETPVAPTRGIRLASPKPLVVPILRAGLGAEDITAITLLSAPEGVARLEEDTAALDVPIRIVTGAIDEKLNERGYIVPGLGDAGDRLYGIV